MSVTGRVSSSFAHHIGPRAPSRAGYHSMNVLSDGHRYIEAQPPHVRESNSISAGHARTSASHG